MAQQAQYSGTRSKGWIFPSRGFGSMDHSPETQKLGRVLKILGTRVHLSFAVSIYAQTEWAGSALNFEALIAKGKKLMDADKQAQIQAHVQALAALLYEETDPEAVKTLEGIEAVVRGHILKHVSPEMGNFWRC